MTQEQSKAPYVMGDYLVIEPLELKWFKDAKMDWHLIQNSDPQKQITEIYYDSLGQAKGNDPKGVANEMLLMICRGIITKCKGTAKWERKVMSAFFELWSKYREERKCCELTGKTPAIGVQFN
jgi:hypothetical protein